ncbi:FkbM family methyltransferase [Calothrix rhizosoleniae]|uniref:FkbM family methyltransferase n=1 Tax=Calothrix rhizosoleniae TaxID=888997 RepID=UPI0013564736|nr:FkbM family methyltransferase [Calothrix rhizosoleniae]
MLTQTNFFLSKCRSLCLRLFAYLENNNEYQFDKNGENKCINNIFEYLSQNQDKSIVLFDIGANKGDYTKELLIQSRRHNIKTDIHAFEPVSFTFNNLHTNLPKSDNLYLNQLATSDQDGSFTIYYEKQGSTLASFYQRNLDYSEIKFNESETVNTIRLEDYISSERIRHISLLKIDVEGHEIKSLEGLGKYLSGDFIDFIQFEYGGANLDSKTSLRDLFNLFINSKFVVAKIMRNGNLNIRDYVPWMENYQYANYVAISKNILEKIK